MKRDRVVVAMSGGVDSSVAAALLKEEGYEVIGITMCFNIADSARKRPPCCSIKAIEDARRVCDKLNIRHYQLNMQKFLEEYVVRDFCREYLTGRTPNPCVRCNQYIKFGVLLKKALSLDAKFLATGHYAKITKNHGYLLKKAKDKTKDQSYFLYRLNQNQLKHTLFPLGSFTKNEVRDFARAFNLPVADKLASQDICFLPQGDYGGFLRTRIAADIKPGLIIDKEGNILGRHRGIAFCTVGQREGLGIAMGHPVYITKIDSGNNTITVGEKEDAYKSEFLVGQPHFILKPVKKKVAVKVRIRYNHKETNAWVMPFKNKINSVKENNNSTNDTIVSNGVKVKFKQPQFAITPGQSAVFYDRDTVLGGGIIDQVLS